MFKWYAKSFRCYVYMPDVDPLDQGVDDGYTSTSRRTQDAQFEKSRWWTRGWTLQELLAPFEMHFFARDWSRIAELRRYGKDQTVDLKIRLQILHATGINIGEWQSAGVAQRVSWAAKRQTTRVEDMAYCLLGLLGVNMPLLYGEGEAAFPRLLAEVIRKFPGHDVLAGGFGLPIADIYPPDEETVYSRPILPMTPDSYRGCIRGLTSRRVPVRHPAHYSLTNAGIYIGLPLIDLDKATGHVLALLDCCRTGSARQVALLLAPDKDDIDEEFQTRFELAVGHPPIEVDFNLHKRATSRWIYIRNTPRKGREVGYSPYSSLDFRDPMEFGFALHSVYPVETMRFHGGIDQTYYSRAVLEPASQQRRVILLQHTDGRNIAIMKIPEAWREQPTFLATITNATSALEVLLQPWTWNRDEPVPDEDLMRGLMQECWDYDLVAKDQAPISWEHTVDFGRVLEQQGWLQHLRLDLKRQFYSLSELKSGLLDLRLNLKENGGVVLKVENPRYSRDSAKGLDDY